MRHRTFSLLPTLGLLFLAPHTGGEGGGSGKPTLEQQLSTAQTDLAKAQSDLTAVTSERDKALADVTSLTKERDNLKSQFDQATSTAEGLRNELQTANGKVTALTSERDAAQKDLASANANVSRLEKLCSLKGVDPNAAVPPDNTPDAPKSAADFQAALSAAKTPAEKDRILSEFSKSAREGKLANV